MSRVNAMDLVLKKLQADKVKAAEAASQPAHDPAPAGVPHPSPPAASVVPEVPVETAAPAEPVPAAVMPTHNRWREVVSLFARAASNEPVHRRLSGPEAFSNFREAPVSGPDDKTGKDGNLWCVGWFYPGKGREAKGGTAKNIKEASFLVFDFDPKQGHSIQSVEAVLNDLGWEYVIYSTFSHGPGAHAFRVVIPLTRSMTRGEHEVLWEDVYQRLARKGIAPDHLPDIGRMFYLPTTRVGLGPPEHYRYFRHMFGEEGSDTETELYPVDWYLSVLAKQGIVPKVYPPPDGIGQVNGTAGPVNGTAPRSSTSQDPDELRQAQERLKEKLRALMIANGQDPDAPPTEDTSDLDIEHDELADYTLIRPRCGWIRYAETAPALSEPEWYAALAIWIYCIGGEEELIHLYSSQDRGGPDGRSRYDRDATIDKAARAKEAGPARCERIFKVSTTPEAKAICLACPHHPHEVRS